MESQDLDKLFRDAFEQAEETPSACVWQGIEQELAQEKKIIPFYSKYRTQLSIAATFLVFFGIGLTFYKNSTPSGKEKIEEVLTSIEQPTESSDKKTENPVFEKELPTIESEKLITNNSEEILVTNSDVQPKSQDNSVSKNQQDDDSFEIEEKQEIIEQDQILTAVDVDIKITQPQYENIRTIEPISNDLQNSFAFTAPKEEVKTSIVTRVLNGITKNILTKGIDIQENKEIEFKNDDEGSITLNIFNSLAKK
ncbi:hypothetical protein [Sphingobacterium bovistauri]|uniref:Uncharacterized protein n=1 Tax=Sphingobacterium bovistauri TaxID=2781959 RepID=A0ABS7Z8Y5_9SPHI|nr:hypothetical protein [Sphingobacterium bovistauri]MCA5006032.1 hypothetical protein [Sphingobacterium bovistauri]